MISVPRRSSHIRIGANLAYLRFESFDPLKVIKRHASAKLGDVADISDKWKESEYYQRLSFWAGISSNGAEARKNLSWARWRKFAFDAKWDASISRAAVWIAASIVIIGIGDAVALYDIETQARLVLWIAGIADILMVIESAALVLGGNSYIEEVRKTVDSDAKQWRIFMQDRTSTAQAGASPSSREHSQ